LISVGIIGEYVGAIPTQVQKRPLVVERERMNFEYQPGLPAGTAEGRAETVDGPGPAARIAG
jgi:hypothetical protein